MEILNDLLYDWYQEEISQEPDFDENEEQKIKEQIENSRKLREYYEKRKLNSNSKGD